MCRAVDFRLTRRLCGTRDTEALLMSDLTRDTATVIYLLDLGGLKALGRCNDYSGTS